MQPPFYSKLTMWVRAPILIASIIWLYVMHFFVESDMELNVYIMFLTYILFIFIFLTDLFFTSNFLEHNYFTKKHEEYFAHIVNVKRLILILSLPNLLIFLPDFFTNTVPDYPDSVNDFIFYYIFIILLGFGSVIYSNILSILDIRSSGKFL